jgi:hypothetical protein
LKIAKNSSFRLKSKIEGVLKKIVVILTALLAVLNQKKSSSSFQMHFKIKKASTPINRIRTIKIGKIDKILFF